MQYSYVLAGEVPFSTTNIDFEISGENTLFSLDIGDLTSQNLTHHHWESLSS